MQHLIHIRPSTATSTLRTITATAAVVVIAIALTTIAVAPWWSPEPWWVELAAVISLAIAAGAIRPDLSRRRIPDPIVVGAAVPIAIVAAAHPTVLPGALFGVLAFAGPVIAIHLASPSALGFGDVKLAAVLGAALGLVDWRAAVLALALASGITIIVAIWGRRTAMPFAPGLVSGAALSLLATIGGWPSW